MLRSLTIKNYALIEELELKPSQALTVMTGETGAGKSIILGALGLLLGERADSKALWNEDEKCVIEGSFDIDTYGLRPLFEESDLDYDRSTVIRRELIPGGKSRAFVNDTPVTLEMLKKLGTRLVDIHSQHETLLLASNTFQLKLIDTFAQNQAVFGRYQSAWSEYLDARKQHEELSANARKLRSESDFINFQLEELTQAKLHQGEQETLEDSLRVLEHAGDIKIRFASAMHLLAESEGSLISRLSTLRSQLQPLVALSSTFADLVKRVESLLIESKDILHEIEKEDSRVEADPGRTEEIQNRLSHIYQLQKKHKVDTVAGLLAVQDSFQLLADKTNNLDEVLAQAERRFHEAESALQNASAELSSTRKAVFPQLEDRLTVLLKSLGIPQARIEITSARIPPGPAGVDRIDVFFSANKGIAPRPLVQVASGGEFSRVMFSIKYVLAERTSLPTLVLDEIDLGISGEIALKLGKMMKEMGTRHQVLVISHLPQIAAYGDEHLLVYKDSRKDRTVSRLRQLDAESRVRHIAEMLAGSKPSEAAMQNARELIELSA